MKKVRIGVLGAYRGTGMINYCKIADNAELVAICDKYVPALEKQKSLCGTDGITYYTSFDEFIKHDMDAVVLANYANEHVPFAIRCLEAGKHVFSEVLPCQTMKEAVELVETVEATGKIYAYGENYCYMTAPYEMRRLYKEGKLGEMEYAEGEYIHNCESIWPDITYGDKEHWRNNMYSTFYCTHSLGPIVHITGLRPVSVVGIESPMNERHMRVGAKSSIVGIEMVTFENGGIAKSIHGGLYKNSIWYSMYGTKGKMECARENVGAGSVDRIYCSFDDYSGQYKKSGLYDTYLPEREFDKIAESFGHGKSDFYTMYHFTQKVLGDENADIIDIYEALDMFLPGMFAFRSILAGGVPMDVPNLRNKEERERWRNDTACTDPKTAGDMLLPTMKGGTPEIDGAVYDRMKAIWTERRGKKKENK